MVSPDYPYHRVFLNYSTNLFALENGKPTSYIVMESYYQVSSHRMMGRIRLISTETHCDAVDTLLDVHRTNLISTTTAKTVSNVVDDALALTGLHNANLSPGYSEDLFSP